MGMSGIDAKIERLFGSASPEAVLVGLTLAFVLIAGLCLQFVQVHDYVDDVDGAISTDKPPTKLISEDQYLIAAVRRRLGDTVSRGDVLLELDGRKQAVELAKLQQSIEAKSLEAKYNGERLLAIDEKLAINARIVTSKLRLADLDRSQIRATIEMDAKRKSAAGRIEAMSQRIIERALPALDSPALSEIEKVRLLANAHADLKQMQQVNSEFQANLQKKERDSLLTEIDVAQLNKERADLELSRVDVAREIAEIQGQIASMRQEQEEIAGALTRLVVRAPVAGTIVRVSQNILNANLVERGEELFLIRDSGSALEAELILTDEQYKDARVGQKVNLELHAWNHYKHGAIEGEIVELSAGKIQPQVFQAKSPAFVARVHIRPGRHPQLQVGYELQARIVLGRISLFDYLLKKIKVEQA